MSKPLVDKEKHKYSKENYLLFRDGAKSLLTRMKKRMPDYVENAVVTGEEAKQKEDNIEGIIKQIEKL